MKIKTYQIVFLFFAFFSFGQNANLPDTKTIKANFTTASVKAYQESATLKVEDFYNYLTILSNETTSEALKTEVKASIYSLFERENVTLIDLTEEEKNIIFLNNLVEKIENKNYTFKVSDFESSIVAADFWTTKYQLTMIQNNKKTEAQYFQKVKFKPILKSFGTTKKQVWTLLLGEIEQYKNTKKP